MSFEPSSGTLDMNHSNRVKNMGLTVLQMQCAKMSEITFVPMHTPPTVDVRTALSYYLLSLESKQDFNCKSLYIKAFSGQNL